VTEYFLFFCSTNCVNSVINDIEKNSRFPIGLDVDTSSHIASCMTATNESCGEISFQIKARNCKYVLNNIAHSHLVSVRTYNNYPPSAPTPLTQMSFWDLQIAMNMVVLISYHLEGTITNPLGLGGVHP